MIEIHYFYFSSVDDQNFLIILWSLNHTPWTSSTTGYCELRGAFLDIRTYKERRHAIVNARVPGDLRGRNQPSRTRRGSSIHVGAPPANTDASAASSGAVPSPGLLRVRTRRNTRRLTALAAPLDRSPLCSTRPPGCAASYACSRRSRLSRSHPAPRSSSHASSRGDTPKTFIVCGSMSAPAGGLPGACLNPNHSCSVVITKMVGSERRAG